MKKILALNANFMPIRVVSFKKAIKKVIKGSAVFVDSNFQQFTFDEWILQYEGQLKTFYKDVPDVILYKNYKGFFNKEPKLNKRNILIRDDYTCQYCGYSTGTKKHVNVDHVIPQSKGGTTTWENTVCSCIWCNTKKGNKSLKDLGWRLKKEPKRPSMKVLKGRQLKLINHKYKQWKQFLGDLYWMIDLEN